MEKELTRPVKSILSYEVDSIVYKSLKRLKVALDEFIALGTHLLAWEIESNSKEGEETAFVIAFFKRALEIIDASSLLIENSSITPIKPFLRILLEISIQLEYLLYDPKKIREKILHLTMIEFYYIMLEAEQMLTHNLTSKERYKYETTVYKMKQSINEKQFDSVRNDFNSAIYIKNGQKKGQRRKTPPKWFELSGGGNSISSLFKSLHRKEFHYLLYSTLSDTVHSSMLIRDTIYEDKEGTIRVDHLRNVSEAGQVTISIIKISIEIYRHILQRRTYEQKKNYLSTLEALRLKYSDIYSN